MVKAVAAGRADGAEAAKKGCWPMPEVAKCVAAIEEGRRESKLCLFVLRSSGGEEESGRVTVGYVDAGRLTEGLRRGNGGGRPVPQRGWFVFQR